MIKIYGLTKVFDDFTAVDGVTLGVSAGEILALLGPNGAGKTTTVRMLAAILRPTRGRAIIAGHNVVKNPEEVRRVVGLLTEQPGLYLRMRGGEYLDFFGRLMGLDLTERERRGRQLLESFDMPEAWDRRMGTYSKGMRQKMALARAMLHDPKVLLLDEPTSAMDPYSAKLVRDAISTLKHHRRAIILCTHNLTEAETLADRIAIISRGKIIALGTPEELKSRYLGPPLMELHLSRPVNNAVRLLVESRVKIVREDDRRIWYVTSKPEVVNPRLLKRLTAHNVEVISLSPVPRNLEEVYLRAVQEQEEQQA